MKIRTDFVSNSSSCSFTVQDVSRLVSLFKPLGQLDYNIDLSMSIVCRYKDYDTIYEIINEEKPEKRITGYYPSEYRKPDPDEETEFYIRDWNAFIERYDEIPDDIKSGIKRFYVSSDDYESMSKLALTLIYEYCQLNGLNPDSSYSEHSFTDTQSDDLVINLARKIGELRNAPNGGNS